MIGDGIIVFGSAPAAGIPFNGANNGLSVSGGIVELGGTVTQNTTIGLSIFRTLTFGTAADTSALVNFRAFNTRILQASTGFILAAFNGGLVTTGTGLGQIFCNNNLSFNFTAGPASTPALTVGVRSAILWSCTAPNLGTACFSAQWQTSDTAGSNGDAISFYSAPTLRANGGTGFSRGFYHNPTFGGSVSTVLMGGHIAFENTFGYVLLGSGSGVLISLDPRTKVGIRLGEGVLPTALLHIGNMSGVFSGTPGSAPLKLTSDVLLTTPENGAFEFDGTHLYFTIGATRNTLI